MDCKKSSSFSSSSSIDDGGVLSAATAGLDSLRARVIARHAEDNVFLTVVASVQYRALAEKASDAFYKLGNIKAQIQAYVFDGIIIMALRVPFMR